MLPCPRCRCEQLYRVRRSTPGRLLFRQSFKCRMCGYRVWKVHSLGIASLRDRSSQWLQRLNEPAVSVRVVLPLRTPRYGGQVVRASN